MAGPSKRDASPGTALVRRIQAESGLTQAALARRAGLPRSVLNVYLRGRREPGADTLAKLAAAAGLEVDLVRRKPPLDPERASKILVQVLELAEALPYRPKPDLAYPTLAERLGKA